MFTGISIIIPYYNEAEVISKCLKGIERSWARLSSEQKKAVEVILVDDCSPSPYHDDGRKHKFSFRTWRMKTNGGVGTTRNKGADLAKFSHVLFLDCDVLLDASTLSYAFKRMENSSELKVLQGYYARTPANRNPDMFQHYMALSWYYSTMMAADHGAGSILCSGCVVFDKSYFKSLGGFLNFPGAGGEEHELVARMSPGALIQDPHFIAHHYYDGITERLRKVFKRGMNYMETVGKNKNIPLSFKVISGIKALSALAMTGTFFLFPFEMGYGFLVYLTLFLLCAFIDGKMMLFILKNRSFALAVLSVVFMQMEYTAISLGMLVNTIGFRHIHIHAR